MPSVEDIIDECFKPYRPIPKGIPDEVVVLVEEKREQKRLEILQKIEEARFKKLHGNKKMVILSNDAGSRADKMRMRLKEKLLLKEINKVGD